MMIERPNWVAITHSCRRWPACPNGASNVRPSPVPNPSREIEKLWTRTWDMAASGAVGDCDLQLFDANAERSGPPVTEVPFEAGYPIANSLPRWGQRRCRGGWCIDPSGTERPLNHGPSSAAIPQFPRLESIQLTHVSSLAPET